MRYACLTFALLAATASASEKRIGQIVSTNASSKNNSNTAAAFPSANSNSLRPGSKYAIQCDVATYVNDACSSSSCTAVSTDLKLEAGQNYRTRLAPGVEWIATLGVSATSTCQIKAVVE